MLESRPYLLHSLQKFQNPVYLVPSTTSEVTLSEASFFPPFGILRFLDWTESMAFEEEHRGRSLKALKPICSQTNGTSTKCTGPLGG